LSSGWPTATTPAASKTNEGNWQVGDTLIAYGNVHYRVTAVVPVERVAEFVDAPTNGVLEVEPL
jgi:hypothetical protein